MPYGWNKAIYQPNYITNWFLTLLNFNFRTEKVVDFQNSLPSVKKATKIKEIRDKFDSIFDESTIEIHKRLEELLK
jgi:hypothetical protein